MKAKEILTIALTNRVLFAIEKIVKLQSTIKGIENIPQNSSIIFTPNHFTRCQTFIVPYLLNQTPNLKFCRSLASSSLFTSN
jgi:1-acyl-sn-glycerol-3-phosphate acyltransferase